MVMKAVQIGALGVMECQTHVKPTYGDEMLIAHFFISPLRADACSRTPVEFSSFKIWRTCS